jgi:Na+/phosphate symporter
MVLPWFMMLLSQLTDKPHEAVAYAHLLMNVMVALMFLPFIDKVLKWLMARFNLVN